MRTIARIDVLEQRALGLDMAGLLAKVADPSVSRQGCCGRNNSMVSEETETALDDGVWIIRTGRRV